MHPRFKTYLIGLAVALAFVGVGFGLGEAPRSSRPADIPPPVRPQGETSPELAAETRDPAHPARRGALKRQLAMPYVSFAALLPRQEP